MAGTSAGEVFVGLRINDKEVKPALSRASAAIKSFGAGVSALSVAAGGIIANVATSAFNAFKSMGQGILEKAAVNPKTAKGIQEVQRSIYLATEAFKQFGVTVLSVVLPYVKEFTAFISSIVVEIGKFVRSLVLSGNTSAEQSKNILDSFEMTFMQIAIMALEASQALLAPIVGAGAMILESMVDVYNGVKNTFGLMVDVLKPFVSGMFTGFQKLGEIFSALTGGMISDWTGMAQFMIDAFVNAITSIGATVSGFLTGMRIAFPEIASKLKPLEDMAYSISQMKPPDLSAAVKSGVNMFAGLKEGFDAFWSGATDRGNEIIGNQLESMKNRIKEFSKDFEGRKREAGMAGQAAVGIVSAQKGFSGTSAILAGSGGNPMLQAQKDMLKEAREQKEIQKKQLEEQKKIAKQRGVAFT
jgi:hypothetical protein